jgi:hypothetical protein
MALWEMIIYVLPIIAGVILLCLSTSDIVNAFSKVLGLLLGQVDRIKNLVNSPLLGEAFPNVLSDTPVPPLTSLPPLPSTPTPSLDELPIAATVIATVLNLIAEIIQVINTFILSANLWMYLLVTFVLIWSIFTFFYIITNSLAWRAVIALWALVVLFMICISLVVYIFLSTIITDLCFELNNPTGILNLITNLPDITGLICFLKKDFDMIIAGNSLLIAGVLIFTVLSFI